MSKQRRISIRQVVEMVGTVIVVSLWCMYVTWTSDSGLTSEVLDGTLKSDQSSSSHRRLLTSTSEYNDIGYGIKACEETSSSLPPHTMRASPLSDMARYSSSNAKATSTTGGSAVNVDASICSFLPAHMTASRLWNEHVMEWILPASVQMWIEGNKKSQSSEKDEDGGNNAWVVDELLLDAITSTELRQGLRSSPSTKAWGHLLTKLSNKIQEKEPGSNVPPVVMVVFGAQFENPDELSEGACQLPREIFRKRNTNTKTSNRSWNCTWPVLLEGLMNRILSFGHQDRRSTLDIIRIIPVMLQDSNTEFATVVAKYDLWPPSVLEATHGNIPSIIVNAYSSHDMINLNRTDHIGDSIDFQESLRSMEQELIRDVVLSQPCDDSSVPILLYLDDYLGGRGHDDLFSETTFSRVVQRLADWYPNTGLGFISYASVVRPFVYADTNLDIFWNYDKKAKNQKSFPSAIYHGRIAHLIMAWTMAYGMLQYTVDFCSYREVLLDSTELAAQPLSYLKPGVPELVAQIVPPKLTLSTSIATISQEWQQERRIQERRKEQICNINNGQSENRRQLLPNAGDICPVHFWQGHNRAQPTIGRDLESYEEKTTAWLDSMIESNQGWRILVGESTDSTRDMIWTAHQEQASLILSVPLTHGRLNASVHVFVKTHSDLSVESPSRLLIDVSRSPDGTPQSRETLEISNTHPSDSTLARHYHLNLSTDHGKLEKNAETNDTKIMMKLTQVTKGDAPIEIVSMMVCNNKEAMLRDTNMK